ncbi:MAG: hypothetical protein FWE82_09810 [Defluviitaleaceae bacterium]|nr:hypothetical protein [Defluviitaleaceae bacterium]
MQSLDDCLSATIRSGLIINKFLQKTMKKTYNNVTLSLNKKTRGPLDEADIPAGGKWYVTHVKRYGFAA